MAILLCSLQSRGRANAQVSDAISAYSKEVSVQIRQAARPFLGCIAILARLGAIGAIIVGVGTSSPRIALAGPADSEARANALYKEAKEKYDARDYDRSFELAEQAEKLFNHPIITLLKGRALRQQGKLREAEFTFKQCKNLAAQLSKQALHVLTDELIGVSDEMRAKGELVIAVEPIGDARVQLDGTEIKVPYNRWFVPGKHKIEAAGAGRKTVTREVEVTAGASAEVKINLDRRDGRLTVVVPGGLRGVDVRIDGKSLEIAEALRIGDRTSAATVDPGLHEVVCVRGDRQVGSKVEVGADAQVDARCDGLEPQGGFAPKKLAGWGGVAAGAGLLGFGAYNMSYYAYKTNSGFVERVPEGGISRLTGGLGYAVVGTAVGVVSWLLFVREGDGAQSALALPGADDPAVGSAATPPVLAVSTQ